MNMKLSRLYLVLPLAALLWASCAPNSTPTASGTRALEQVVDTQVVEAKEAEVDVQEVKAMVQEEKAQESPIVEASSEENTDPIEVTYFTPSQTEGPYYPVSKPQDSDSDLVVLAGASKRPSGEVLQFGGRLYDATGSPVPGAVVEIWQTDDNGVYLHPRDPSYAQRDTDFQHYGESVTGKDGSYSFRTLMPGRYQPRPQHIHVKVRLGERELLTTQFYFSNDPALGADSIFAGADEGEKALIMDVTEGLDLEGNPLLSGNRDIILRTQLQQ